MTIATDKDIKTAVLDVLKEEEETRSLKIKKLRKRVHKRLLLDRDDKDESNEAEAKWEKKFESILQEMELGKKIKIEDDIVTKLSKKRPGYTSHNEDTTGNQSKTIKHQHQSDNNEYNSSSYNKYMPTVKPIEEVTFDINELWKNGEQVYRQELLSYEYLTQNPDNITRLFVGE